MLHICHFCFLGFSGGSGRNKTFMHVHRVRSLLFLQKGLLVITLGDQIENKDRRRQKFVKDKSPDDTVDYYLDRSMPIDFRDFKY